MAQPALKQHVPDALPVLDIARASETPSMAAQIMEIAAATRQSPTRIMRDFSALAFGPGKIAFADYVKMRLFDESFYAGADRRQIIGQRRNRDICVAVNYRHDWFGLVANKVATLGYLKAYGFPLIPTAALYAPGLRPRSSGGARLLADRAALEAFLLRSDIYPLFGKPVESYQSLGSIGLTSALRDTRMIEKSDGSLAGLDAFLDEIEAHYAGGYLFQPMVAPHPSIEALCGRRLATARIVTILTEDGPQVFRASWKIPSGANTADNYWRAGNLLAQLDLATGVVQRATSGTGLDMREHDEHPTTGRALAGFELPHWQAMKALAVEGARLMRHLPMIGWDMACTADGPTIVEMNETPDLFLVQFADRRGVFDDTFKAFIDYQKTREQAHADKMKRAIARL